MLSFFESTWFLWWILTVVGIVRCFNFAAYARKDDVEVQEEKKNTFTSGSLAPPISRTS